jgi:hypothetical protein
VRAVVKGIANAAGSARTRKAALTNNMLPGTLLTAGETLNVAKLGCRSSSSSSCARRVRRGGG